MKLFCVTNKHRKILTKVILVVKVKIIKNYLYTTNYFLLQFLVELICCKYLNVFHKTLFFILLITIYHRNNSLCTIFRK